MHINRRRIQQRGILLAATITASWAAPAMAQDGEAAARSSSDIIVTAQKREERLIDVPGAITAVTAERLLDEQKNTVDDYFTSVPGLSVQNLGNGRTSISIRGVTTGNTQRAAAGIVVDDIPFTATGGNVISPNLTPDLDPALLQRIEVLRGPQGTLYGAATIGGLLKYVTTPPSLTERSAYVQIDGNTVERGELGFAVRGILNTPLVDDRIGLNASMFYRRDGGYIDDSGRGLTDFNRTQTYGGRIDVRFRLSEAVDLRLGALLQIVDNDGPSLIRTDFNFNPQGGVYNFLAFPNTAARKGQLEVYSAILNIDLGGVDITSLTGYLKNIYFTTTTGTLNSFAASTALFGVNGNITENDYDFRKFSQEIRISSSGTNTIDWMIGAFYTDEHSNAIQNGYAVNPATGARPGLFFQFVFPADFTEYAGFANATWHAFDWLDLQAGVRYSRNDQAYDEVGQGPRYVPPYRFTRTSNDEVFTYLATFTVKFTDHLNLYGRVASGYRPGGPQTAAVGIVVPDQVDPDRTVNYEMGLKGQLFDRALNFDLAVFRVDWTNIQLSQTIPEYGLFYVNAGNARTEGVEFAASAQPWEGGNISGNVTYTDAKLTSNVPNGFVGRAGDRLPISARWTWSVSASQDIRVNDGAVFFVGGQFSYVGDRFGQFPSSAANLRQRYPSFTQLDARLGLRLDDRYTVTLYARNLTDEFGVLNSGTVQGTATTTAVYATTVIRPRTVGISLAARY